MMYRPTAYASMVLSGELQRHLIFFEEIVGNIFIAAVHNIVFPAS
jgi:hypothetical protein